MTNPDQPTKSPATSQQVNRAEAETGSPAHPTVSKYHGVSDLVDKNPEDTPSVDIMAGPRWIGVVYQLGHEHHAFGRHEQPLGVFPDFRAASRVIQQTYTAPKDPPPKAPRRGLPQPD